MSADTGQRPEHVLPIYQGLLDELDQAARATIIQHQGEGINPPGAEDEDGAEATHSHRAV